VQIVTSRIPCCAAAVVLIVRFVYMAGPSR
jgi:hypothetical protein